MLERSMDEIAGDFTAAGASEEERGEWFVRCSGAYRCLLPGDQRSKLQRRIRELLQDAAELRQERNSYEMQCLEHLRRINALEGSYRKLEEEKKDSEKGLYRYVSALQDKSTQLLQEMDLETSPVPEPEICEFPNCGLFFDHLQIPISSTMTTRKYQGQIGGQP